MRALVLVSVVLLVPGLSVGGDKDAKPLTPEEAAKKINEKCTVEMVVQSVGKGKEVYFLNSKEDFKDKANFTIFVNKEGVESLKQAKIDDPVKHFKGKTVRVTGTVSLYQERPQIILDKAGQIQIVEKK
jgi:DNA/RNA endonuclease YhcR with UshA esterase domain